MSMNSYQVMIQKVTEVICEHVSEGQNYILIGDNSSGKSEILRNVIEKKMAQSVYFIDSVNRTFDVNNVELVSKSYQHIKFDAKNVTADRINAFNFNLRDTFHAASCIEQLYDKYSSEITDMCETFLHKKFCIVRKNLGAGVAENKILMDGTEIQLSSGYQAIFRLFCELLFFDDVMQENKEEQGLVVIDEIDEYLSPKYSAQILNYLQEQFPKINFLVTTHSLDLVKCTRNTALIIIKDATYEIYANREVESVVSAEDIFTNLFFEEMKEHSSENDEIDEQLRKLLNLKIAGMWDETAQIELQKLKEEGTQAHQKMICKQIEEW